MGYALSDVSGGDVTIMIDMQSDYDIKIAQESDFPEATFYIRVEGGSVDTSHRVRLHEDYYRELTGGNASPRGLVQASFEFLLEREPNTAILNEFSLPTIERYFPEYSKAMQEEFSPGAKEVGSKQGGDAKKTNKRTGSLAEKLKAKLPKITFKGEEKQQGPAAPKSLNDSESNKESYKSN